MLQEIIIAKTDPFFDICFSYSESTSIINVCNATEGAKPKEDLADEERFKSHIFFRFVGCRLVLGRCKRRPRLQGYVTSFLTVLIIKVTIDSL